MNANAARLYEPVTAVRQRQIVQNRLRPGVIGRCGLSWRHGSISGQPLEERMLPAEQIGLVIERASQWYIAPHERPPRHRRTLSQPCAASDSLAWILDMRKRAAAYRTRPGGGWQGAP